MKSKNQRRRQKKKEPKPAVAATPEQSMPDDATESGSKLTVLARKYDWLNEKDPLYEMYHSISSKLKRKRDDDLNDAQSAESVGETEGRENADGEVPMSKKQQRLSSKPGLAALKALTSKPELIEWFDADAQFPEFLVHMKSIPGAVQVPFNWRLRQEIPQFGPKPPYELPVPIKKTKITEVRERQLATAAQQAQGSSNNMKLDASASDLDYDLFHSAFFGSDAVYAHPQLLPFGHIVDLKLRNRAFKPAVTDSSPTITTSKAPPKSISAKLRAALGLKHSEAAPWTRYVVENGRAPGFSSPVSKPKVRLWGELQ